MSDPNKPKDDFLVTKPDQGPFLVRRFTGEGNKTTTVTEGDPTNDDAVESAVARAAKLASRDKVDLWFSGDNDRSFKKLKTFR